MSAIKKFWILLNNPQKARAILVLLTTIVGAALEAAGVGLIVPFVSVVTSDSFTIPSVLTDLWPQISDLSKSQILTTVILLFLSFYIFKTFFILWLIKLQATFYYSVQGALSVRLFKSYIGRNYSFHLNNNSAKLLSNTITETTQLAQGFASSFLLLINDVLIIVMILVVLFLFEPVGALVSCLLFGSMSFLLFAVSKSKSASWGQSRQDKEAQRVKSAQQGFNGVKDIKLYGRENLFIHKYQEATDISLKAGRNQTVLQQVPKVFLELVAVSALSALIAYLIFKGDQSNLVASLSLFAAAAFKLLPTLARLVQSSQAIIFNTPVVTLIFDELFGSENGYKPNDKISTSNKPALKFEKNIKISNLALTYDDMKKPVLHSINLDIEAGKMIGFIGSSGAGKSSLIDCILGLITPSSGTLKIDDEILTTSNISKWQKNIGYVSQAIYLVDASLKENIAFGVPYQTIDDDKLQLAVEKSQLGEFVASLPDGLETKVGEHGVRLSGGQRQRIGIARALYNDPPILVLDEATSALDVATEAEVMTSIQELHSYKTVLIITHRISTVKNCDYIYKLKHGRVVEHGRPDKILVF